MKVHVDFTIELEDNEVKDFKEYFEKYCHKDYQRKFKDYRDFIRTYIYANARTSADCAYDEMIADLNTERGEE